MMPTAFVTHGGGPMPLMKEHAQGEITQFLAKLPSKLPFKPKAIVVFTAHWETPQTTIGTSPFPPMLYDYQGFPPECYKLSFPAQNNLGVVSRIQSLLKEANIPFREDSSRGYDHGTFIPLMISYPQADVPVIQMSVLSSMDPGSHSALGRALAPLRSEGVLLLGSGSSFHNFAIMRPAMQDPSSAKGAGKAFDTWLRDSCTSHVGQERNQLLEVWANSPGGREAHPREEHLIPLMVVAGAAGESSGQAFATGFMGISMSSFLFGDLASQ